MAPQKIPDEEYAKLLIPTLQQLIKAPPWDAPSYEVRMHKVRQGLGKSEKSMTNQEIEEKALQALAIQLVKVARQKLGDKEFEALKLETQKLSLKGNYTPFYAMVARLAAKGLIL